MKEKLFKLRQEVGKIERNKTNPFLKSKYFDINQLIEQIDPVLVENRLLLTQPLVFENGLTLVRTVIEDIDGDGIYLSDAVVPETNDPQKLGSSITYLRRYTLQSLLGLQAGDDDGNTGSGKVYASESQKNHMESLLHTSTISEDEKVAIERRIVSEDNPLTKEEASRGIEYLSNNQKESLDDEFKKKTGGSL